MKKILPLLACATAAFSLSDSHAADYQGAAALLKDAEAKSATTGPEPRNLRHSYMEDDETSPGGIFSEENFTRNVSSWMGNLR